MLDNQDMDKTLETFEDSLTNAKIPEYQKELVKRWKESLVNADYVLNMAVQQKYAKVDLIKDMTEFLKLYSDSENNSKQELTVDIGILQSKRVPIKTVKHLNNELRRYRWNESV